MIELEEETQAQPKPPLQAALEIAKKAESEARTALEKRLVAIKSEKKTTNARLNAEAREIRDLLRVKMPYTRKLKPIEAVKASA